MMWYVYMCPFMFLSSWCHWNLGDLCGWKCFKDVHCSVAGYYMQIVLKEDIGPMGASECPKFESENNQMAGHDISLFFNDDHRLFQVLLHADSCSKKYLESHRVLCPKGLEVSQRNPRVPPHHRQARGWCHSGRAERHRSGALSEFLGSPMDHWWITGSQDSSSTSHIVSCALPNMLAQNVKDSVEDIII